MCLDQPNEVLHTLTHISSLLLLLLLNMAGLIAHASWPRGDAPCGQGARAVPVPGPDPGSRAPWLRGQAGPEMMRNH